MKKEKYISEEAKQAILSDIMFSPRDRQRAAENACRWANSPYMKKNIISTLEEAYNNCSTAKWRAYHYCLELCRKLDGYNFQILGHNCMTFSVGFEYVGKETGALCYAYITRDHDSFCFQPADVQ